MENVVFENQSKFFSSEMQGNHGREISDVSRRKYLDKRQRFFSGFVDIPRVVGYIDWRKNT